MFRFDIFFAQASRLSRDRPQGLIKDDHFYPAPTLTTHYSLFTIDNSPFTTHYSPKN
jgi:hypothetical protein